MDIHLLHEDYELVGLREGVAILRNAATGRQIERRVVVNLNNGSLRVADPEPGQRSSRLSVEQLD